MSMAAQLRQVEVSTEAGYPILTGVDLEVARGEILALVGESGSGKSTLALSCMRYVRPGARFTGGEVVIDDEEMWALTAASARKMRGRRVAYVPQNPMTALNPARTVRQQIDESLRVHTTLDRAARKVRIHRLLVDVDLSADVVGRRYAHQLSGGQQQRVVLAIALACEPAVLVLDEPTTGLDVRTQAGILELIRSLPKHHDMGILYITHDLLCVKEVADRVAVMYGGEIVELGSVRKVIERPSHPYTRALIRAVPASLHSRVALSGIPGSGYRASAIDGVCRFSPRCPFATDACTAGHPELEPEGSEAGAAVRCVRRAFLPSFETPTPIADDASLGSARPVLVADDLSLSHGGRRARRDASWRADNISFVLHEGETLGIVGESGSGKTTLGRCLAGLHPQTAGSLSFQGETLSPESRRRTDDQRRLVQFIHQNPDSYLNPRHRIRTILANAARAHRKLSRDALDRAVVDILGDVRLTGEVLDRFPGELSGGEKQRVAIARALICEPTVLICDEITSALDVSVQAEILSLLGQIRSTRELSIVFVTHNMSVVRAFCDGVLVMYNGEIVERGPVATVFDAATADYTRDLMAAIPGGGSGS